MKNVVIISDNLAQRAAWGFLVNKAMLELRVSDCELIQMPSIDEALVALEVRDTASECELTSLVLIGQAESTSAAGIQELIHRVPAGTFLVIREDDRLDAKVPPDLTASGVLSVVQELTKDKLQIAMRGAQRIARLNERNKRHAEFTHMVSHDLKGPLNQMAQFCALLQDDKTATDDEKQVWFRIVNSNSKRLLKLVKDLDDFCRLESPLIELEPCNIADVLDLALKHLETATSSKIEVIEAPSTIVVNGNSALLSLAIRLIVLQRFEDTTCPAKKVTIDCSAQDGTCCIHIRDDGVFMNAPHAKQLLEPLPQNKTSPHSRCGRAMASSLRIVEGHGGEIRVSADSENGNGIAISLPLSANTVSTPAHAAAHAETELHKTVS